MKNVQLPLPGIDPELTPVDRELLRAISSNAGSDGSARSLFNIATRHEGIDYKWASLRLRVLEILGYVTVQRAGPGYPLVIRRNR